MDAVDETTVETADTETVETETPAVEDDTAKWKAMARKHEREAKALQKQLADIEAAKLTDLERAQQEAKQSAQRAEEAEMRAMRIEVAAAKGLSPAQAKRLVGSTREELEADADEIVAEFGSRPQVTAQSTGAGAVGPPTNSDDPNSWLRRAVSGVERRP